MGGLERGVPVGGKGGMLGAALGEGGAVEAEFARGEPDVAGLAQSGEEAVVLVLLGAGERARHIGTRDQN